MVHPFHGLAVGDKVLARVIQLRVGAQGQGLGQGKEGDRKKASATATEQSQGEGGGDGDASSAISVYLSLEGLTQPHQQQQTTEDGVTGGSNSSNGNPESSSSSSSKNKRKRTESVDSLTGQGHDDATTAGGAGGGGKWAPMVQLWGKHAVGLNTVHTAVVTAISSEGPSSSSSSSTSSSSGSPIHRDVTGCIVSLSPYISARLHYLDVSSDLEVVRAFRDNCFVGQRVLVAVTGTPTHLYIP